MSRGVPLLTPRALLSPFPTQPFPKGHRIDSEAPGGQALAGRRGGYCLPRCRFELVCIIVYVEAPLALDCSRMDSQRATTTTLPRRPTCWPPTSSCPQDDRSERFAGFVAAVWRSACLQPALTIPTAVAQVDWGQDVPPPPPQTPPRFGAAPPQPGAGSSARAAAAHQSAAPRTAAGADGPSAASARAAAAPAGGRQASAPALPQLPVDVAAAAAAGGGRQRHGGGAAGGGKEQPARHSHSSFSRIL